VSYAESTDQALEQALGDDNSVSLFVQFPDPDNDRFKLVAKRKGVFVPVIDRTILRQQVGGEKIYFAEETEVRNAKFWRKGEVVNTICTPMVVFTGNPDAISDSEQKSDHADLIKTLQSVPLDSLQPKQGWLAKYWSKTRALSAEAVEKMMDATEKARDKAAPYVEQATEKARELGEKASPYVEQAKEKAKELGEKAAPVYEQAKELGEKAIDKAKHLGEEAAPMYEQAKEKAKELSGQAIDKARELGEKAKEMGEAAKQKLQQQQ
jgi:F0F1-type ATP synthase membrane subunit b/b'